MIILWWFDYKIDSFDMYQNYCKPLNYAHLEFKNNCQFYAFITYSVHKSKETEKI